MSSMDREPFFARVAPTGMDIEVSFPLGRRVDARRAAESCKVKKTLEAMPVISISATHEKGGSDVSTNHV